MTVAAGLRRVLKRTPLYGAARVVYRHCFRRDIVHEQRAMRRFYAPFVRRGAVCIDVGANYGSRTEAFRALGARVIAVEPAPRLARALRERFGRDRAVQVVEAALGAAAGRADLHVADINKVSTMSADWVQDCARTPHLANVKFTATPVEVTTLDAIIARAGPPCFIKIDVEGFEQEVLRGLTRPVESLSFECTPWRAARAEECVRLLAAMGRWRFNVSRGETLVMRYERWLDDAGILAYCRDELSGEPEYGDIYAVYEGAPGA